MAACLNYTLLTMKLLLGSSAAATRTSLISLPESCVDKPTATISIRQVRVGQLGGSLVKGLLMDQKAMSSMLAAPRSSVAQRGVTLGTAKSRDSHHVVVWADCLLTIVVALSAFHTVESANEDQLLAGTVHSIRR